MCQDQRMKKWHQEATWQQPQSELINAFPYYAKPFQKLLKDSLLIREATVPEAKPSPRVSRVQFKKRTFREQRRGILTVIEVELLYLRRSLAGVSNNEAIGLTHSSNLPDQKQGTCQLCNRRCSFSSILFWLPAYFSQVKTCSLTSKESWATIFRDNGGGIELKWTVRE
jgi:hypothetical protein